MREEKKIRHTIRARKHVRANTIHTNPSKPFLAIHNWIVVVVLYSLIRWVFVLFHLIRGYLSFRSAIIRYCSVLRRHRFSSNFVVAASNSNCAKITAEFIRIRIQRSHFGWLGVRGKRTFGHCISIISVIVNATNTHTLHTSIVYNIEQDAYTDERMHSGRTCRWPSLSHIWWCVEHEHASASSLAIDGSMHTCVPMCIYASTNPFYIASLAQRVCGKGHLIYTFKIIRWYAHSPYNIIPYSKYVQTHSDNSCNDSPLFGSILSFYPSAAATALEHSTFQIWMYVAYAGRV